MNHEDVMKLAVLNAEGREVGAREVLAGWERRPVVPALLHQAVVTILANERIARARTKGRGEVRGGGRKPWRQKGTGRARHGSIRSPIWRGGGVAHGPRAEETYGKRMPVKMRRAALAMALVAKARDHDLRLVEAFPDTVKTRDLVAFLAHFNLSGSILLAPPGGRLAQVRRAGRNIPRVRIVDPGSLNAADVLNAKTLLMTPESWQALEARVTKSARER